MIAISGMPFGRRDRDAYEDLVRLFAEETYHWPNLAAVVVGFGAWARHGAVGKEVEHSFLLRRRRLGDSTIHSILVLNPYCEVLDAEAFRALVRLAFVEAEPDLATGVADYSS